MLTFEECCVNRRTSRAAIGSTIRSRPMRPTGFGTRTIFSETARETFRLETGHNPDAVLMSLPPVATWLGDRDIPFKIMSASSEVGRLWVLGV